ncbi:GAF domain-containing protein [Brachybacterium sp. ACRRE]|uniref:GAF domain-containing protein n=1 Tax=Brachybacterium sp. ACRRE TaxID=2918184 RepID=UPI001EF30835|nr:GAF domain-containing protein [Brachybacterium sp. ACRRE]MCG7309848.1 GAF domain-containing protein [Brachybacterium sp. ACRRE]
MPSRPARIPDDAAYRHEVLRAHEDLPAATSPDNDRRMVRDPVLESWRRSLDLLPRDAAAPVRAGLSGAELAEARRQHAFSAVLPLLQERLIDPAVEAGLLVALGDQQGRLLWLEGPSRQRTRAEDVGFTVGADWSEDAIGTNAPALALASGSAIQVAGAEHYVEAIQGWSCSAVPLLDPATGEVLGVIDVTGDDRAVGPLVLPLLRAAARAVQAELPQREDDGADTAPVPRFQRTDADPRTGDLELLITGRRTSLIRRGRVTACLSGRHAELLTLLHLHPDGMGAGELAESLYGSLDAVGTVRAEVLRLRRVLEGFTGDALTLGSRPYRLQGELGSDLLRTRAAVDAGDVDDVLAHYEGRLLPASEAPEIRRLREWTSTVVRALMLEIADHEQLWRYAQLPENGSDLEVLMAVLTLAPPDAPERAAAAARAEALEAEGQEERTGADVR